MSQILGFMAKYKEHRICDVKKHTKKNTWEKKLFIGRKCQIFQ